MSVQSNEAVDVLNAAVHRLEQTLRYSDKNIASMRKELEEAMTRRDQTWSKLSALRAELGDRLAPATGDDEVAA